MLLVESKFLFVCIMLFTLVLMLGFFMSVLFKKHWLHKFQALNSFGTLVVVFITIYVFYIGRPDFIDLAIIYAVLNIVGMFAILKFTQLLHIKKDKKIDD